MLGWSRFLFELDLNGVGDTTNGGEGNAAHALGLDPEYGADRSVNRRHPRPGALGANRTANENGRDARRLTIAELEHERVDAANLLQLAIHELRVEHIVHEVNAVHISHLP